ncbi:Rieske 2Fe-2S domain-containing protein [Streptomyces sp. WMMB 322]|uniref:Rieske 2Fe-2S domain-containing protein n=1 Tax=Streptomyces sp. WMMB 322 TaxID=1286821 RepID=UPI0006E26A9C|nr:Rieske 2Fe-2S domain-containing protein [Streptomyces sp. WMMB 322]SCK39110.1 Ferredoxin subunit of nitrite reductase or a ring-hydroxylating dioxygenase [Streptomyces sp. WMMB 322]
MSYSQKLLACASALRAVLPDSERQGRVLAAIERTEQDTRLDPPVQGLQRAVHALPLSDEDRDVLHGHWLGHPLHPALVQVPLGTWFSAAVLDLIPGKRRHYAPAVLIATGLVAAVPAAVTGWVDWAELRKPQMRVGLLHAIANSAGVILYAYSLGARVRGHTVRGRAFGYAGLTVVAVGGALGGHLAYRQAAAVNHAEDIPVRTEPGWHALGAVADFPVGKAVRRIVGETPVLVVRASGNTVHVLADRCSHMAGPLSQGELVDGCVRCPWHGSVFRLSDGWNVSGPATSPQPVFETRHVDGVVEARLA